MGTVIDREQPWAVPVTVIFASPRSAVDPAVNLSVEAELVDEGENVPVSPVGRFETESVTFDVNPLSGVTVTVSSAEDPCTTRILSAGGDSENPFTTTVSESESDSPPPVLVTVNVSEPRDALQLVVTVSTEVQFDEVTGLRENDPDNPVPSPETESVTFDVKPSSGSTSTS